MVQVDSMKKRLVLIMNPTAGKGRAEKTLPELVSLFTAAGYLVSSHLTDKAGDATKLAAQYGEDTDLLVCCGGDGTLNETVNGLMTLSKRPQMGYIPAGTTNDFAISMSIPRDMLTAAGTIINGQPFPLDVGKLNNRYFAYLASFGAFTGVSHVTPQNAKNAIGWLAYILEGIRDMPNIRSYHVHVEAPGHTYNDEFIFGAVSNSLSIGGLFKLDAKIVDLSDGKFEVLLIKYPNNPIELGNIIAALQTQDYDNELMYFFHTAELTIRASDSMPWTLDGEFAPSLAQDTINNIQQAIEIIL